MSDMVERVALAIQKADGMPLSMARCHARAAIEAMREPTEEMLHESINHDHDHGGVVPGVYMEPCPYDIWQIMIDTALGKAWTPRRY